MTAGQARALVAQLYADILGRAPDAFGDTTLVPLLLAGYDPAAIRAGLAYGSPEAASLVAGLYAAELGRAPDAPGLAVNLAALATGATLADVRAGIAASPEARTAVSALYAQVLGRPADSPGLALFTAALGTGLSLASEAASMAASPEAAALATTIFAAALGRAPSAAELTGASSALAAGGPALLRAQVAAAPETQARLAQAYELNFGTAPSAATLAAQTTELALGRTLADTTQVTAKSNGGGASLFTKDYGYQIPQAYIGTGSARFLSIVNTSYILYQGGVTTADVATTGASAFAPGPDTIAITVQTATNAPVSFIATLDGQPLGGATVTAPQATQPFAPTTQDRVTFTGAFGPGASGTGLHDLHIQLASDPAAGALTITGATFGSNAFLLGTTTTNAGGATDLFPHPGPQPPLLFSQ